MKIKDPLFTQDATDVVEIYGEDAIELALPRACSTGARQEKVLDILHRPDHYAQIVRNVRVRLAEKHSYTARIHELLEIVKS